MTQNPFRSKFVADNPGLNPGVAFFYPANTLQSVIWKKCDTIIMLWIKWKILIFSFEAEKLHEKLIDYRLPHSPPANRFQYVSL